MKCPKCSYLGFDAGDRCRNCGYDFSLVSVDRDPCDAKDGLSLRPSDELAAPVRWDDSFDQGMTALETFPNSSDSIPPTQAPAVTASEPVSVDTARTDLPRSVPAVVRADSTPVETARTDRELPLFGEAFDDLGDELLIKVPVTPRPPLAVRRTPRSPSLKVGSKASRSVAVRSELELWDMTSEPPLVESVPKVDPGAATVADSQLPADEGDAVSGAARRFGAVVLDHALLLVIDLSVMYFTLRMVGLSMADWRALPLAPLAAFLLLVKLSYFWAFTAAGGQTIGKMAARIRVVTMGNAPVDGSCALTRALAGIVSVLLLGLGYLPALAGGRRLALHDYMTHTRVVVLRSV